MGNNEKNGGVSKMINIHILNVEYLMEEVTSMLKTNDGNHDAVISTYCEMGYEAGDIKQVFALLGLGISKYGYGYLKNRTIST